MNAVELFNLEGRKALVTGAGRGIGRVLAISLAQTGCDIAILEKNIEDAHNVVQEIINIAYVFPYRAFSKLKNPVCKSLQKITVM